MPNNNHVAQQQPQQQQQQQQHQQLRLLPARSYDSASSPDDLLPEDDSPDGFVEVSVSEPIKAGEGISSYLAYRVTTRTNLASFKRPLFSVTRRFSDFLGLHERLSEKHAPKGRVIPPPPEKSLVGGAKVRLGQAPTGTADGQNGHAGGVPPAIAEEPHDDQTEFIARRRGQLEKFINRVVAHPVLRRDPNVARFLESGGDLPRATSTSALSSASVMRLFGKAADAVSKVAASKPEEADPWYREKVPAVEALEAQLKKLLAAAEGAAAARADLARASAAAAVSFANLSAAEEAPSLQRALSRLSRAEERAAASRRAQAAADSRRLVELLRDHVALVGAAKSALNERAKAFQAWEHARHTLLRKREQRSRLEMGGKADRVPAATDEVQEWENR